jgi:hypothetical protein
MARTISIPRIVAITAMAANTPAIRDLIIGVTLNGSPEANVELVSPTWTEGLALQPWAVLTMPRVLAENS